MSIQRENDRILSGIDIQGVGNRGVGENRKEKKKKNRDEGREGKFSI